MPTTANGLPYPASTDAPDGPGAVQALAAELDHTRIPTRYKIVTGSVTIPGGSSSASATISYGQTFENIPHVLAIVSGGTAAWALAVTSITTTQCSVNARHVDANTAGGTVNLVLLVIDDT